jgi:hypothetical protein
VGIAGIIVGYFIATSIDLSTVSGTNDLVGAMLKSDLVSGIVNRTQVTSGLVVGGMGVCLGMIMFGIGSILDRLSKLNRSSNA